MAGEVEVLARDWKIYVDKTGGTSYVEILGLNTLSFSRSKTNAKTTDFQDQGAEAHLVASRSKTIKGAGNYLENSSGEQDQGQADMEYLGEQVGAASIGRFKLVSPSGKIREFYGSVNIDEGGPAGVDEASKWGFEIERSGPDIE